MKVCPNCQTKYQDDANFCPQESCATPAGPRRLEVLLEAPAPRYELATQIGGSRSGEVWQARDLQTGATVIYKKVAAASLPTPATSERAQRELKQLQRAQNPRLARVLDFGKDPQGGRLFVVSELCDGQSLDRLVAETGSLPLDRAKKIVAQIGEALLEGQKVGVVHHDLSPKNVLVTAGDDIKVINFISPVPVTETILGVPEYLSPEQAEGKLVDQRSNTYSLGAILSLMLSGQPPISGPDAASVLDHVQRGEVVPPSRSVAGLTPEIDRVVLKAMDKSPNRRPLTLRQFLTDVAGLVGLGAAPAADRGAGFAKTMMFAGGSAEVQKLVAQALAARGEAGTNGSGAQTTPALAPVAAETREPAGLPRGRTTPPAGIAAPPSPQPTPAPQLVPAGAPAVGPRRSHGAAIAATMVALPAQGARFPVQASGTPGGVATAEAPAQATPPPAAATPAPLAETASSSGLAPTPKPAAGGTFRETLWFKKGDVDQMVAEARSRVEAARGKVVVPEEPEAVAPEDARPLEDRYVDDGTVTVDDRKKFSLRSGGTATALPAVGSVPGDRMSESEMIGEIGGGKRIAIIAISVVVGLGIIIAIAMVFRGKNVASSVTAITPVPIPTQVEPPAVVAPPAPPPVPAPPPAAVAAPPAAPDSQNGSAAAGDGKSDDAPIPKTHTASHKHAAKKGKGGKKHR